MKVLTHLAAYAALPVATAVPTAAQQQESKERDSACILSRLRPSDDARLFVAATRVPPDVEAMTALVVPAVRHCVEDHNWDRDRSERAVVEGMAAMLARHSTALLARDGIQVATLDRWFRSLPPEMRVTLQTNTIADLALSQALSAAGADPDALGDQQPAVSAYLAYLVLMERIERGLPLDAD